MPAIPFGVSAYRRDAGNMPEVIVSNMFAESAPTAEGGVILNSRKGLLSSASRGAGPVRGVFYDPGTFGGDLFVVSGDSVYRAGTLLGTIDGSGPVSFASSGLELVITAGSTAYSYNGTNLAAISLPDSFSCLAVAFIAGLFIYIRGGSQKFYWSAALDGRTVDALDFASAESSPDGLYDVLVIGDNLFLLGASSVENWRSTGGGDLPFAIIPQRTYTKGIIATGCAAACDNALFWIASDGLLCRSGDVPERVSDPGVEERIVESASRSVFAFTYEGHAMLAVRLDSDVFLYDASTRQFNNPRSYGLDRFRVSCATMQGPVPLLGDDTDGTIWTLDGWEDNEGPLVREFTAFFPIDGGSVTVNRLSIEANVGWTGLLEGQGSDPVIEMAYSRDAGATFSDWEAAELGAQGEYRALPEWRALGQFDAPGAYFKFRCSDPVGLRVSKVLVNEKGGGRSR